MRVPLLDLKAQYAAIKPDVDAAVRDVLESQHFILGPKVEECERAVAGYCGCQYGVGVSSGSDALLACLMAEGIGPGDEVITTPYTFFATAGAIARVGATPVFVDIDPDTFNLDVAQVPSKLTSRTRAIIPVHLFGQMADMEAVMAVATASGLIVIEDAAQAIGAEHRGRRAGSIGHYGCFSFFPSKNLGAAGDGGMIVTNDPVRAERLRCLRAHGSKPKYHHRMIGGNFRLDAVQAAVVTAKLPHLDRWTAARQRNASVYDELLGTLAGGHVQRPLVTTDRHIFNQYVITVTDRDALKTARHDGGVESEIYYPVPMHLQECFAYLELRPGMFPISEQAARQTLAIPVHPDLTEAQVRHVADSIGAFYAARPVAQVTTLHAASSYSGNAASAAS
jgi:dTDP-4-amino-4,6-dideoxygalactose transaminase